MDFYRDDGIFLPMINDTGRNVFYKNAIDRIAKDNIICDIGTGTGILSILAAHAGAKKVIALEKDYSRYQFAKSVFEKLELTDKIDVVHADFIDTKIKADYFVTETFGNAIFEENILKIAEHKKLLRGQLIPDSIEVYVKVFQAHLIFSVCQQNSEASKFQPDIIIDSAFENIINDKIEFNNSRANWINNLFRLQKQMDDLKLQELYKSDPLVIDFNKPFPKLEFNFDNTVPTGQFCIFWKLKFQDLVLDVTDTIWATPTKFIPDTSKGVKIYYDNINSWWFEW